MPTKSRTPQPVSQPKKVAVPEKQAETAHEMWKQSRSPLPYSQWRPTAAQQARLDQKFGGGKERG